MAKETTVNPNNPFAAQDYAIIINSFEKESTNYSSEEYALVSYYKDVYSTKNFSARAQEQLSYYPGMHQSIDSPEVDPFYTEAKIESNKELEFWNSAFDSPDSFMNALRDKEKDFDYQSIFGSDLSAEERAKNIGKMITECIPCFGRITDLNQLLPNGNLLSVHLGNINARFDLLDDIKNLFNNPGNYIDVCELLNLFSSICPSDLIAMVAMLTQYLAKINLDINFNIDFIVNLVGPILSPFLDSLSQWLDKWMQLIIEPMICVVDHINTTVITAQQAKIPFSGANINIEGTLNTEVDDFFGYDEGAVSIYEDKRPEVPSEEINQSIDEMKQSWRPTETEEERRAKFAALKGKSNKSYVSTSEYYDSYKIESVADKKINYSTYYPPEKQTQVKAADAYFNAAPLADSLIQVRNILQASVQYANDWFTYITQMIYDLLNVDVGWMKRKTGTSFIKSRLIQVIAIIKAILEAANKNGLNCGTDSNFDEAQMKFILEDTMSKYTNTKFKVNNDGTITITMPGEIDTSDINATDLSTEGTSNTQTSDIITGTPIGTVNIPTSTEIEQKAQKSGIIVKNCLRGLTKDQIAEVENWITEYERSLNG